MECRRHDHHNHGVCPSCLRERLSRLPAVNNIPYHLTIQSPSPPSSSSSPASTASAVVAGDVLPMRRLAAGYHHQRVGSMSFAVGKALKGSNNNNNNNLFEVGGGLKKSRSMAFLPRDYFLGETKSSGGGKSNKTRNKNKKKKNNSSSAAGKSGFWTKLFPFRVKAGGTEEGLVHHVRQSLYY